MELCLGRGDELVESLWVRIRGQTLPATDCLVRKEEDEDRQLPPRGGFSCV